MDTLQFDPFQKVYGIWGLYIIWEPQKVPGQPFWLRGTDPWSQRSEMHLQGPEKKKKMDIFLFLYQNFKTF